jgi:hypothetical protein
MRLSEVLEAVRVGDDFFRESKPDILYERTGTLIERDELGWATLEQDYSRNNCYWQIIPEQRIEEDVRATDWILQKGHVKEFDPLAKPPRLKSLISEKTRNAWTFYDQMEMPQ